MAGQSSTAIQAIPTYQGDNDSTLLPQLSTIYLLLDTGRFARVPHLYGTNSDEGTDNARAGWHHQPTPTRISETTYLSPPDRLQLPRSHHRSHHIMELYPGDPVQGIGTAGHGRRALSRTGAAGSTSAIAGHPPRRRLLGTTPRGGTTRAQRYAVRAATYVYRWVTRTETEKTLLPERPRYDSDSQGGGGPQIWCCRRSRKAVLTSSKRLTVYPGVSFSLSGRGGDMC